MSLKTSSTCAMILALAPPAIAQDAATLDLLRAGPTTETKCFLRSSYADAYVSAQTEKYMLKQIQAWAGEQPDVVHGATFMSGDGPDAFGIGFGIECADAKKVLADRIPALLSDPPSAGARARAEVVWTSLREISRAEFETITLIE